MIVRTNEILCGMGPGTARLPKEQRASGDSTKSDTESRPVSHTVEHGLFVKIQFAST